MNINQSPDKMSTILIVITVVFMGIFALVLLLFDVSGITLGSIYMAEMLLGVSLLLQLITFNVSYKLYRSTILDDPLLTTVLTRELCVEYAAKLPEEFGAYLRRLRNMIFTFMAIGLLFMTILTGGGAFLAGMIFLFGFTYLGASAYFMNHLKYLPPDVNDGKLVLGAKGVLMYGKFYFWETNGAELDSFSYMPLPEKTFGLLTICYHLIGNLINLEIPIPNELSDQIPRIISRLEEEKKSQRNSRY